MDRTVLLKVGGSLLDWPEFPTRLGMAVELFPRARLVIVVGGGALVDVIRRWDHLHALGDQAAHGLALWGLETTARLVARLVPRLEVVADTAGVEAAWGRGRIPVFSPRELLEAAERAGASPLAPTWDTTSDSLAALVATRVGAAELVLLKSASSGPSCDRREAARLGLVDPNFPDASAGLARVGLVNLRSLPLRLETLA